MKLKFSEKKQEAPDVTTFIFHSDEPISWRAGQYIHYVLHHEPTDDRGSDRWFTVSAAPFERYPRITTRYAQEHPSSFKKSLFDLKEGDEIEISAVEGDFILPDPTGEYVFIAGGIGITPYRAILKQLDHEGKSLPITLLYSNHDQNIVFKEELETLKATHPEFNIHYVFSPEHIDEAKIRELIPDIHKPIFYISGPEPMVESLGNTLKSMGISEDHIKQDWFPGYPAD
jgi:ferredoxin-NADP reductase